MLPSSKRYCKWCLMAVQSKTFPNSLGIGENLIYRWKSRAKHSSAAAEVCLGDQEALHKRIGELELERDILKKALSIFSRGT